MSIISPASIPVLAETFYLSQGERQLLVASDVGEGIFFAGQNHVALRVVASEEEHGIITTNPEELLQRRRAQNASETTGPEPTSDSQTLLAKPYQTVTIADYQPPASPG